MSRFLRDSMQDLESYTPGEQPRGGEFIKLNTNESPYPPGPNTIKALREARFEGLRLYPDPLQKDLKEALAKCYSDQGEMVLEEENIFLSNGSDDIINFAFAAFCGKNGKVIFPEVSYGFYKVFADYYEADAILSPMKEGLKVDINALCRTGYDLKIIANPNAPTGEGFSIEDLERIINSDKDAVVLVDEAYVDFGGISALPLIDKYENLIISRTFSKSWSMAGARLGYALGQKEIISDLELIKYSTNPYNINAISQIGALGAISEAEYYRENCKKIIETRENATERLRGMGFNILPSQTNFIFLETMPYIGGREAYIRLKEKGILVRWFRGKSTENYLRITIGKPEEMEVLINALKEMIEESKDA